MPVPQTYLFKSGTTGKAGRVVEPVVGFNGGNDGKVVGSDPGVILGIGGRMLFGFTTGMDVGSGDSPLGCVEGTVVGVDVPVTGAPDAGAVAGVFFSSGLHPTVATKPIATMAATLTLRINM